MKKIIKTVLLILILAYITSCTGTLKKTENSVFENIDANNDGSIVFGEFSRFMKENAFKKLDQNNDDFITRTEWENLQNVTDPEKHAEMFKKMDENRNKRISFFEFSNYADKNSNIEDAFMVTDEDKNNSLSPDEISALPIFRMITIWFRIF